MKTRSTCYILKASPVLAKSLLSSLLIHLFPGELISATSFGVPKDSLKGNRSAFSEAGGCWAGQNVHLNGILGAQSTEDPW